MSGRLHLSAVGDGIKVAEHPGFYLEIPPYLFETSVKELAEAGLTRQLV
ncbi:MAG TPA: hypothetical protein VJ625_14550 [Propionibacteriaceae bacterium]|nr:hypothetical protein [Propionibacteriaceae bacterium]